MKILVLTSEPVTAQALRDGLGDSSALDDAEVMVVAPALQDSPLKFLMSDADDAIARAEAVRRETVEQLGQAGVSATGDTGESDPAIAIQDALQTFRADRIVLFLDPDSGRYREDVDPTELQQRFSVPVTVAT